MTTVPGFEDYASAPPAGPLGVGLHYGVSPDRYHADPCERPSLSSSVASLLVTRSAAHAKLAHPRLGNGFRATPTDDMSHGTLMHRLLLKAGGDIVVVEPKTKDGEPSFSWATADAKAAKAKALADGKIPVLLHKLRAAEQTADFLRANLAALDEPILLNGRSEVVAVWEEKSDQGAPVLCRAMLDHWAPPVELDLKISEDASPDACIRKIGPLGYALQRAAYRSALEHLCPELAGRIRQLIVWCESEAPHCVVPVELSGEFLEYGQRRWRRAVNRWAECLKSGRWPGYTSSVIRADPPPWLLSQDMDEEIIRNAPQL